jgi:uncharacterized protein (DUF2252 family)
VIAAYRGSLPEHTRTLFDRYHHFDYAIKVVGVGSVGTVCGVCLFMAADDDPLFLQVKEARASVLEPYAGKSLHPNQSQRVVVGQRIISDGERHLPRMDAREDRPRCLSTSASRHEDVRGHRGLG